MIDEFKEIVNCHIKNKEFLKLNWSLAPKEARKNINQLSNTEMLLLKDIVEGRSYKNNRVGLTVNSAKVYVFRMKKKLNIKTRNELIVYYIRNIK